MNKSAVSGISVVIPNYNGRQLLPEILPSVKAALLGTNLPHEIIISDDCSTDDSVAFLQTNHPELKLLTSDINLGFSPTINRGIFAASHSHLLLLNSDVKLSPDYFSHLLRYFDREDSFGVMGRIVGWNDGKIQDGGKYPSFHGLKIKTSGNYIPATNEPIQWLYSMYLSGANAFVDRAKMVGIGGFDELFAPFYVEDFELSLRAWRLGWKCYYEHHAVCRHKESVTIKQKSKKSRIKQIYYRNKMFLHAIHLPALSVIAWHFQLLGEIIINLFAFRFYFIKAAFQYLGQLSPVLSRRRAIKAYARKAGRPLLNVKDVTSLVRENVSGQTRIK